MKKGIAGSLLDKRSFTLIELLVASAILGILVTICFVSFKTGSDSWIKSEARIQRYQNARGALEQMAREISQAFISSAQGISFVGTDGSTVAKIKVTAADIYQVFFVAPLAQTNATCDLYKVGYWRGTDGDTLDTLQRVFQGPDAGPNYTFYSGDSSNPLALHVTGFELWYWDEENSPPWFDYWDSRTDSGLQEGRWPTKVKITIKVRDEKAFEEAQDFSTVVVLPTAQ